MVGPAVLGMAVLGAAVLGVAVLGMAILGVAASAQAGTVTAESFESPTLKRAWDYNVYLPDGYESRKLRYPVLYLLHGVGQNRDEWVRNGQIDRQADLLIAAGQIPPCVIIMPTATNTWWVNGPERMQDAFFDDMVPYVDAHFRTINDQQARVIAGESMGGFGALRLLLLHPHLFAAAALLSPAVYAPEPPEHSSSRTSPAFMTDGVFDSGKWTRRNYPALIDGFAAAHLSIPLYIMSGIEDEFHIQDQARLLFQTWRKRNWPGRLLLIAGRHNFETWRPAMPDALRYIFRRVRWPVPEASRLATLPYVSRRTP